MKKLLFLLILISPSLAKAQAFSTGYAGDKQSGMGNTGTGLALDAASMNYNPASISFLKANSISIGGAAAVTNTSYLDANNNSLSTSSNPVGTPFHANFVYGVNDSTSTLGKFKFGIGITTPYGGSIKYDPNWTGNNVIISKTLATIAIAPTVSFKFNDKLSLGVSGIYSMSSLQVQSALPVGPDAILNLKYASSGWGLAAGLYFKATEKLSLGLSYLSQVNSSSYKGTATFTVPSSLTSQFPSGNSTFSSSVPQVIALGGAYKVNDKLLLALDVSYSIWSCFNATSFYYSTATSASAVQNTILPNNYKNAITVGLGGQYKITDKFTARAGVAFNQTPVPTNYVYPDVPDANRINLTAGLSYHITQAFSVDVSYRFIDVMKQTSTNKFTNMYGTYATYGNVTGLTLNYNF